MTKNKLNWDIGWFGTPPTDEPERATSRQNFFVECMQCDRYSTNHHKKCKTRQDLVDLYRAYRERIDLSGMGFTVTDSDLEAVADTTWADEEFQEAIGA
jgi:hypothetical protein